MFEVEKNPNEKP